MNLAELGVVLTIIAGLLAGAAAAHDQKAGWAATIFFTLFGLLIGIAIALAAGKLAYAALDASIRSDGKKNAIGGFAFCLCYLLLPLLSIAVCVGATVSLTILISHLAR